MSKRALIYARVSYDDQARSGGRNLEGQIKDGRAYCQEKGYRIVAELAEDDRGASGADWDLPKLNEALDKARAGEADVLVTRELDRFARGLAKQLVVESEFKRQGVEVEYILAEYDDSPEGKLNKHIRAVIAEFEREKINQRMSRGRRNMVKSGKVMLHGNKPPYGYRLEDGMLIVHEPEARIVRLIFTWYTNVDGLTSREIARRLTEMRVPTWGDTHQTGFARFKKRKPCEWAHSTVADMLACETYVGLWHYCKNGVTTDPIPLEVPPIISREAWEKAQERRAYNRETAKRNTKREYLLGRRVTCGGCGGKMFGAFRSPNYSYYRCPGQAGRLVGRKCNVPSFRADEVDAVIWRWIKSLLLNPKALQQNLKEQQAEQERANQPLRDRLAATDDLLSDNRRQLEKLLDLYLSGDFPKEVLTERKARLETTIAALEKERANLVTTLEAQTLTDDQIATIEDFTQKVAKGLEKADQDFEARRQIIDLLDVRVTLAIEDEEKIAYVRCLVDETALSIESTSTRACGTARI